MRVHHLNCGTMRPIGGRLVDGEPGYARRAKLVCHCLLLETGDGLVLVESGLGTPAVERRTEWLGRNFIRLNNPAADLEETAVRQVRRLGFDPRDVRHIVLSHLDIDHAGGLVDFPDATVHVYAEELRAYGARRTAKERYRYRPDHFAHGPRWAPHEARGDTWLGFEAVRPLDGLPPDILLIPLAGHTRGHAGIAVDTGDGWLLHAGDAYFHAGEVDPRRPYCPPLLAAVETMLQTEGRARRHNRERLRELSRDHGDRVRIQSAHSVAEFRRALTGEVPTP